MFQDSAFDMNGGGFISSQTGASPSSSQPAKSRKADTIIPISIRDIYENYKNDGDFKLCDVQVTMVTFVALVKIVDVQSTNVTYHLNDCTARNIVVRHWISEQDGDCVKPLMENTYARIVGSVRNTKNEVFVLAHNVFSITDLNELTSHLLEVVHVKLALKKRSGNEGNGVVDSKSANLGNMQSFSAGSFNSTDKFSQVQSKVLQAIKSYGEDEGCDRNYIKKITSLSPEQIQAALTMLQEEGHIFPTIDNDHFASTS